MSKIFAHWRKVLVPMLLCVLLTVTACSSKPTSSYSQVQKETSGRGAPPAVVKAAEQGAKFNQFFPDGAKGYTVVPTQEKKGFAEYKLEKDGKTLAMLSVSDTLSVPGSATKYEASTAKIGNYPAVDQGTTATGILVNNRYQVKVMSRDPGFTREDRVAWIQKFNLQGLAKLKGVPAASAKKLPASSTSKAPALPSQRPNLVPQPAT